MLEVVKGYRLELVAQPVQSASVPSSHVPQQQHQLIGKEITELLKKRAVEPVKPSEDQFVSRIFLVLKKDGSYRPVFNLRPLNRYIESLHFKMEGLPAVKELLRKDDWLCTMDLKDAYLSVAVAQEHRKYLRFTWEDETFQFTCLPFGLSSAPRVFTKLLRPVMAHIRRQGLRSVIYLDDLLLMSHHKDHLITKVKETTCLLESLGFWINRDKSQLCPSQEVTYLGFVVDSRLMSLRLPQDKLTQVRQACTDTLQQDTCSLRELAKIVGMLSATQQAVLPAPLHYRRLQLQLIQSLRRSTSFDKLVTLNPDTREDLEWWIHHLHHWNGRKIEMPSPDTIMETDASKIGWGATCEGARTGDCGHHKSNIVISIVWSCRRGSLQ